MTKTAHTPGPWQLSGVRMTAAPKIGSDTRLLQLGPDGDPLALVFFDMKTGRGHHDARLIAAAPELLEALETMVNLWVRLADSGDAGHWDPEEDEEIIQARAALSKARGETQEG